MSRRATAAAIAAVAGIAASVAGCGGAEQEAGEGPIVVDEVAPRFGGVGFGSTIREVERLLG